jgi:hypothetical protein
MEPTEVIRMIIVDKTYEKLWQLIHFFYDDFFFHEALVILGSKLGKYQGISDWDWGRISAPNQAQKNTVKCCITLLYHLFGCLLSRALVATTFHLVSFSLCTHRIRKNSPASNVCNNRNKDKAYSVFSTDTRERNFWYIVITKLKINYYT